MMTSKITEPGSIRKRLIKHTKTNKRKKHSQSSEEREISWKVKFMEDFRSTEKGVKTEVARISDNSQWI